MTTRHAAAQNDYPFYPVPEASRDVSKGILDLFFVIQGEPTGMLDESSSSASSGESSDELSQEVYLIRYEDLGSDTRYTFQAEDGSRYWLITFLVPNTGGEIGQVRNNDGSDCRAVLIYNTDFVMQATADIFLRVEPGRSEFYTEQVDAIRFYNIWRCSGSETEESSVEVLNIQQSSGGMSLDLVDGHNTVVEYDTELTITGGTGLGQGIVDDPGNTSPECSSSPQELELEDVVTTINGIAPDAGDIPIRVSNSIGTQRSPGRIELIIRTQ